MQQSETKELFYFYPQKFCYNPASIEEVYIVGEFNEWGRNTKILDDYKLIKDKTEKWIGLIDVPKGKHPYKFFLNKNTYVPDMGHFYYSTVLTPEWAKNAIWYQIMVDRFYREGTDNPVPNLISWDSPPDYFNNFGGNLKGIKKKIPYLKNLFGSLKNKALYLNPINKSVSNHKYWPEDFEAIDPQLGTEEDLEDLTDALHKEGAKIIIDLVYNHTGLNHYTFIDILKNGKNSKYFGWYRDLPHLPHEKIEIPVLENYLGDKPQNITIINDPRDKSFNPTKESYISVWDEKYKFPILQPDKYKNATIEELLNQPYYKLIHIYNDPNYKCWANLFEIPELNTKNPDLKKHLFKAAKKWIRLGIDGFRLDVPDILVGAHEFWQEFRDEITKEAKLLNKNPGDIYIVGEIWSGKDLASSFLCGDNKGKPVRFDAIMNYPVRENILNFFSGEILNRATDSVMKSGEITVSELDQNLHKNLGYVSWEINQAQYNVISSHDTRRIRTILKNDRQLKAILMMLFTLPGAPTIYYGDELGMTGGKDPANRATMRWDIFENLLHHKENDEIFNLYKKLVDLRHNNNCLINAPLLTVLVDNENKIYAYARYNHNSDCSITIVAKDGLKDELDLDISDLPFEDIESWQNPISEKPYINYGKNVKILPEDFSDSYGLILLLACD